MTAQGTKRDVCYNARPAKRYDVYIAYIQLSLVWYNYEFPSSERVPLIVAFNFRFSLNVPGFDRRYYFGIFGIWY